MPTTTWGRARWVLAVILGLYSFFARQPPAHEASWITTGTGRLCLLLVAGLIVEWNGIRHGLPRMWNQVRGQGLVNQLQTYRREVELTAADLREQDVEEDMAQWEYNNVTHSIARYLRLHARQYVPYWKTPSATWDPGTMETESYAKELDFAGSQLETIIAAVKGADNEASQSAAEWARVHG